jgi:hypothetical protein
MCFCDEHRTGFVGLLVALLERRHGGNSGGVGVMVGVMRVVVVVIVVVVR